MFILNYFKSLLDYFKIFQKKCTLVLLGLDNAGKTTFLYRLKDDRMSMYDPTLYAYSEEIQLGNLLFKIVDVGGHKSMRKIWRNFYMNTNAIIYVVDAASIERLQESKEELKNLFNDLNARNVPILVLGNKIDLGKAVSEEELIEILELKDHLTQKENKRKVMLFMCSIAKKTGYKEGLIWLNSILK